MMNSLNQLKKPIVKVALGAIFAGFLLGLLWGWVIQPLEWTNATPAYLSSEGRTEYLRMALDSFSRDKNEELLLSRYESLGETRALSLKEIVNNLGQQEPAAVLRLVELGNTPSVVTPTETSSTTGSGQTRPATSVLVYGAVLALAVVGIAGAFYILRPNSKRMTPAKQATEFNKQFEKTDFDALAEDPPLAQYVSTYVLGDDLFDDSFSIESPSGDFLGECGVGISEIIGVGDPKKVTAFEVWVFDKNDIQTITKVLLSPHAFNDANTRAKLESKGELILVEQGSHVTLETATLQMVAQISDLSYGQGSLPQGSFFERASIEIAIWPK